MPFRREGFSPSLPLLMPASSFPAAPPPLTGRLPRRPERSPTAVPARPQVRPTASAPPFMPDYLRRIRARPVSCYALFKGWLLLSLPPGCLRADTSFAQLRGDFRALAGGLGCSPLGSGAYPPEPHCPGACRGIRSSSGLGNPLGLLAQSVALPPRHSARTLPEKAFRGERAISGLD